MPESLNTPIADPIRRGTTTAIGAHEDVSLYEYFETRLHALDQTQRGLVLAQHEYFDAGMNALDARLAAQVAAQRDITQARFDASQQAIVKAELSTAAAIIKAEIAADKRFDQLLKTQNENFGSGILALDARLAAQIVSQRDITKVQFDASQAAIIKAETATEKRFEAVNEFREQLSDQATKFATKDNVESWTRESRTSHTVLADEIQRSANLQSKALTEHSDRDTEGHADLSARITTAVANLTATSVTSTGDLNGRLSNLEGRIVVYSSGIGIVVTILSALFALIGHIIK